MNFFTEFFNRLQTNIYNDFHDNYDFYRFGPAEEVPDLISTLDIRGVLARLSHFSSLFNSYQATIDLLADDDSKMLLVKLLLFKVLGHRKYKLPLSKNYFSEVRKCKAYGSENRTMKVPFVDGGEMELTYCCPPMPSGEKVGFFLPIVGIYHAFIVKQYFFDRRGVRIRPGQGDVVIDAGACWGEVAIHFADSVGENGKVYSFEFVPDNIKIFKLNQQEVGSLGERIELIENPLWSEPGKELFFHSNGPATQVAFEPMGNLNERTWTESIDSFVSRRGLKKIDFIKMDIEGAELSALSGAVETIKTFKPRLAITVYHGEKDIIEIPQWLNDLHLGYRFYLGHYTIHSDETVLYATPE